MRLKRLTVLFLLSIFSVLVIACGATEETNQETTTDQADTEVTSFPLEVTDATGKNVTLEEEPETIVSTIPSNTEILFALDLSERVIGVTENDNYPEDVADIEKVGDYNINVEKVISLDPDLVLAHESSANSSLEAFEQIEDADIPVYFVQDAQSIEATYESILEIGTVTGAIDNAEKLVEEMKDAFAEIEKIAKGIPEEDKKSVIFEVSPEPEIYTGGQGTFFHELIELIGAKNAAGDLEGWAQIDAEAIVDFNPDVIITLYGNYVEDAIDQVKARDGFNDITAIKEDAVYDLDEDTISRPGPRLVDGARNLGESVYPDYFK